MVTAASRRRAPAAVSRGGWGQGMGTCSGPVGGGQALLATGQAPAPNRCSCESGIHSWPCPCLCPGRLSPPLAAHRPQKAGAVVPASGESLPSLESRGGSGSH